VNIRSPPEEGFEQVVSQYLYANLLLVKLTNSEKNSYL